MRAMGILATVLLGLVGVAAVGFTIASLPELKRYIKMETM